MNETIDTRRCLSVYASPTCLCFTAAQEAQSPLEKVRANTQHKELREGDPLCSCLHRD